MSNLPCTFSQEVKFYDAGNILCDEISMEEGQRLLGLAVERILELKLFPIVLGEDMRLPLDIFRDRWQI